MKGRTVSLAAASWLLATLPLAHAQVSNLHWRGVVSGVVDDPANWGEAAFPPTSPNVFFGLGPGGAAQRLTVAGEFGVNDLTFEAGERPAYTFAAAAGSAPLISLDGDVTVRSGRPVVVEQSLAVLLVPGLHRFTVDPGSQFAVFGALADDEGPATLVKAGDGRLELGGDSTFRGGLTVTAGELRLRSSSAATSASGPVGTGTLRLEEGTRLTAAATEGTGVTLHNPVTIAGHVAFGQAGENLTLAGPITGTGTLEVQGDLTLSYSGNDYVGDTNVQRGTLTLTAAQALPFTTKLRLGADARLVLWFDQVVDRLLGDVASQVELAAGTLTVDFISNSSNDHYSGTVFGPGALRVAARMEKRIFAVDGDLWHTGGTSIGEGAHLQIGRGGATGSLSGAVTNAGTLSFHRDDRAAPLDVPGRISGPGAVVNTSGFTIFSSSNPYSGGTTVAGGTLAASAAGALGTELVTVQSGGTLSVLNHTSLPNRLSLMPGSRLAGDGQFDRVTIGEGVTLAPGAQPHTVGTLQFRDLTLGGGGLYEWNLLGPDQYDRVVINGTNPVFTLAARPTQPFILRLVSLSAPGLPGVASGFSDETYTWTLFQTASAALNGFDAAAFTIDSSAFLTNLGPGDFLLARSDGLLQLTFTPVPEPSTYLLMLVGLGVAGWRHRRRLLSRR